ncbi:AAA family ATPase [Peptoniphilus sp. MSJ-1]|uniref:AAA family ATPase n=1 Tax=Peptoniphilus ovalis TaxID=2841503 RepID=A0ABS6FHG7_9FIRM|nr:AAA family ATPase [Peptoniphilus ovalis]MBU5669620.1 AAA family ATPase [Peptoniphilus ovalis]
MDLLNLQKRKPIVDLNQYNFTLYGSPGIGKSSVASYLFDDPLFLAWEQGQNALEVYVQDMFTWKDFLLFVKEIKKINKEGKQYPFKSIVVDTVDIMRTKCEEYVCMANGWDSPADGAYGAGWAAITREFEKRISEIEACGLRFHYIAHDKVQTIDRKDVKYDKITLQLGSTAVNQVIKKVDFILYFDKEFEKDSEGNVTAKRVIRFDGGENYEAKARINGFPQFIYAGNTAKETANIIKSLFKEKAQELLSVNSEEPIIEKDLKDSPKVKDVEDELKEEKPANVENVTKAKIEELLNQAMKKIKEKKATPEDIQQIIKKNTTVELMNEISNTDEFNKVKELIENL